MLNGARLFFTVIAVVLLPSGAASAQQVWTASPITVSKAGAPTAPQNQDRITANVWITRGSSQGIYNIAPGFETAYVGNVSPQGTRWAFAGLNGNPTAISAANHAALNFTSWEISLGGSGNLATNILDRPGVVHLMTNDIYIDIRFTDWGRGSGSGNFIYTRASAAATPTPVPLAWYTPLVLAIALAAIGTLLARHQGRSSPIASFASLD